MLCTFADTKIRIVSRSRSSTLEVLFFPALLRHVGKHPWDVTENEHTMGSDTPHDLFGTSLVTAQSKLREVFPDFQLTPDVRPLDAARPQILRHGPLNPILFRKLRICCANMCYLLLLWTRGCKPWRRGAVKGAKWSAQPVLRLLKRCWDRIRHQPINSVSKHPDSREKDCYEEKTTLFTRCWLCQLQKNAAAFHNPTSRRAKPLAKA